MLDKLEQILPGSKTYIIAVAMFIMGFAGYINPDAAGFIGGLVGMDPANVMMIAALIMAGLRKITNGPAKVRGPSSLFPRPDYEKNNDDDIGVDSNDRQSIKAIH